MLDADAKREFDVHPDDSSRVVIKEGGVVAADLGLAKDALMARAIADFLARTLDLGHGLKSGPP